ncbi:hypothetical protein [Paenibacillus sp.]
MQFPGERLRAYIALKLQNTVALTISTPTGRFSPVGFFVFTHNGEGAGRQTIIVVMDEYVNGILYTFKILMKSAFIGDVMSFRLGVNQTAKVVKGTESILKKRSVRLYSRISPFLKGIKEIRE